MISLCLITTLTGAPDLTRDYREMCIAAHKREAGMNWAFVKLAWSDDLLVKAYVDPYKDIPGRERPTQDKEIRE